MKVLKFGGTSMGKALDRVADIVVDAAGDASQWNDVVVVVSALSGVTNSLENVARSAKAQDKAAVDKEYSSLVDRHVAASKEIGCPQLEADVGKLLEEISVVIEGIRILQELSGRTLDLMMSFGERLSCTLLTALLQKKKGIRAEYCDARELFVTDGNFTNAKINRRETEEKVKKYFETKTGDSRVTVVTGFIATSKECNETTTLGRGGGDLTASMLGSIVQASEIQVWTDVDGVMTANPNQVPSATVIPALSYEEAMEISYFGAKVIYAPTMAPAMRSKVPIRIKNTFNPSAAGTLIRQHPDKPSFKIRAITSVPDITVVVLAGSDMVGVAGIASRLFSVLARGAINVILISQASSEHSICLAIDPKAGTKAKKLIDEEFEREIEKGYVDEAQLIPDLSVIAVIGAQMKTVPGIAGLITTVLGEQGINIVALAQGSSELNMSIVVDSHNETPALQSVHQTFFNTGSLISEPRHLLRGKNSLHVFLILGNSTNPEKWLEALDNKLTVKIAGIYHKGKATYSFPAVESNNSVSPTRVVRCASIPGVSSSNWGELVHSDSTIESFYQQVNEHRSTVGNVVDCVLIDQGGDSESPKFYNNLLSSGAVVVSANSTLWKHTSKLDFEHNSFLWSPSISWIADTVLAALLSQRGVIKRVYLTEISPDIELFSGAFEKQLRTLSAPCKDITVCYGTSPAESEYSILIETDDDTTSMQSTENAAPRGPAYILRKMAAFLRHPLH